jgi:hypothetical protein
MNKELLKLSNIFCMDYDDLGNWINMIREDKNPPKVLTFLQRYIPIKVHVFEIFDNLFDKDIEFKDNSYYVNDIKVAEIYTPVCLNITEDEDDEDFISICLQDYDIRDLRNIRYDLI